MFLGKAAKIGFDLSVTFFSVVSMWLYAVLFAISMAETLPLPFIVKSGTTCDYDPGLWAVSDECRVLYWTYLVIFLAAMLIAATQDLSGMVGLQKGLAGIAFTCVFCMIATTITAIANTPGGHVIEPIANTTSGSDSGSGYVPAPIFFDYVGFGKAFSAFVFAQLCHHGVPGLIQLMEKKDCHKVVYMGPKPNPHTMPSPNPKP